MIPTRHSMTPFFDTMCRQNFPDVNAVVRAAALNGWYEITPRLTGCGVRAQTQRVFRKDGLMLIRQMAQAQSSVSPGKSRGLRKRNCRAQTWRRSPELGPGNPKWSDFAQWTQIDGIVVPAGVALHKKRVRAISISIRKAR